MWCHFPSIRKKGEKCGWEVKPTWLWYQVSNPKSRSQNPVLYQFNYTTIYRVTKFIITFATSQPKAFSRLQCLNSRTRFSGKRLLKSRIYGSGTPAKLALVKQYEFRNTHHTWRSCLVRMIFRSYPQPRLTSYPKRKSENYICGNHLGCVEQVSWIEQENSGYKAEVLPLNYTCLYRRLLHAPETHRNR